MAEEKDPTLLGNRVEALIKKTGADKLVKNKKDCGCKKRREQLNKLHERMRAMRLKVLEQQRQNQKRK